MHLLRNVSMSEVPFAVNSLLLICKFEKIRREWLHFKWRNNFSRFIFFFFFFFFFFCFFFNKRLKFLNATRTCVDYDSISSNGMAWVFGKMSISQIFLRYKWMLWYYFAPGVARIEKKSLCNILYPNQSDSSD